jgi:hypothetical protein
MAGFSLVPQNWHQDDEYKLMSDCVKSAAVMWFKLTETFGDHYEIWITVSPTERALKEKNEAFVAEGEEHVVHHLVYDKVDDTVTDYSCGRCVVIKRADYPKLTTQRQQIKEVIKWGKTKILKELKKLGVKQFGKKMEFNLMNVLLLMFCEHHRKMKQHNPKIADTTTDWHADAWKKYYGEVASTWQQIGGADQDDLWESFVTNEHKDLHLAPKIVLPNQVLSGDWAYSVDSETGATVGYVDDKEEFHTCRVFQSLAHPFAVKSKPFLPALLKSL